MTWHRNAACAGHPTEWWYPKRWNTGSGHGYAQARVICETCPVRQDCLNESLTNNEQYGMWGGLTPKERGSHGHRCGTTAGYLRHYRAGEPPCRPCLDKWNERSRNNRRRISLQLAAEERREGAA